MSKITLLTAVIFVLLVDVFAASAQFAIDSAGGDTQLYPYDNSVISQYDAGNYTVESFNSSMLPASSSGVTTIGEYFTDLFQTVKNWFLETTGLKYITGLLTGVPNLIKNMGLPLEVAYMLGVLWHAITLLMIVAFFKG